MFGYLSENFVHVIKPRSVVIARIYVAWFMVTDIHGKGRHWHKVYQLTVACMIFASTVFCKHVSSKEKTFLGFLGGVTVEVITVPIVNEGYFHATFSSIKCIPQFVMGVLIDDAGEEVGFKFVCHTGCKW